MRRKLTKREEILNTIALFISTFTLLFFYIIPGWPFRHIGAYGGSMPFSSIPQQVIQQVKTNSNKDIQPDGVIFILYYQNDSGYHLVSFKLSDKYGGKETWFDSAGRETTSQDEIALNINRAVNSGLHAYVKEGYAARLQWYENFLRRKTFIFKLYHILPETTFNWFRIVHKAEIDKYVFKETFEHYTVTHYTGVYPEFP
jgi:hypothetical protein